jgi:hypothetical protein
LFGYKYIFIVIQPFNDNSKHSVQNTNLVPNTVENIDIASDNGSTTCTNETDVREFGSNYSSILSLVGFNNLMGTNLSHETIATILETKRPLDKIYLLEVHAPFQEQIKLFSHIF